MPNFGVSFSSSNAAVLPPLLAGTALGLKMTLCPYSSDELHVIHRVLEEIIAEAKQSSPNMDVDDIIRATIRSS